MLFRPAVYDDILNIDVDRNSFGQWMHLISLPEANVAAHVQNGWVLTAHEDNRIYAIGGVITTGLVGHTWVLFCKDMKRGKMVSCVRETNKMLEAWLEETGIPLTAYIRPDYPEAERWIKLLGYKPVGAETWVRHP